MNIHIYILDQPDFTLLSNFDLGPSSEKIYEKKQEFWYITFYNQRRGNKPAKSICDLWSNFTFFKNVINLGLSFFGYLKKFIFF